MSVQQIYLRISGKVHGPYTKKQIHSGLKSNKIPALAEIAKSVDGPWESLAIVLARSSKPKAPTAIVPPPPQLLPSPRIEPVTEIIYDAKAAPFFSHYEQFSVEWFKDKIEYIIGDDIRDGEVNITMPDSSLPGWQARALEKIRVIKSELAMLKKEIGLVMQNIRTHFSNKTTNVGLGGVALLASLFVKRRYIGKANQLQRMNLKMEKQTALQPYENLKTIIAQINHGLDAKKHEIKMGE